MITNDSLGIHYWQQCFKIHSVLLQMLTIIRESTVVSKGQKHVEHRDTFCQLVQATYVVTDVFQQLWHHSGMWKIMCCQRRTWPIHFSILRRDWYKEIGTDQTTKLSCYSIYSYFHIYWIYKITIIILITFYNVHQRLLKTNRELNRSAQLTSTDHGLMI